MLNIPNPTPNLPASADDVHRVECRWVPGSTDRVRFQVGDELAFYELKVEQLAALVGRQMLDDMYLKGRAVTVITETQLRTLG